MSFKQVWCGRLMRDSDDDKQKTIHQHFGTG